MEKLQIGDRIVITKHDHCGTASGQGSVDKRFTVIKRGENGFHAICDVNFNNQTCNDNNITNINRVDYVDYRTAFFRFESTSFKVVNDPTLSFFLT